MRRRSDVAVRTAIVEQERERERAEKRRREEKRSDGKLNYDDGQSL